MANKAKSKRLHLQELNKQLSSLIDDQCLSLADNFNQQNIIKVEIEKIYEEKARSCIFRSKDQWYKEGECNSKYFL